MKETLDFVINFLHHHQEFIVEFTMRMKETLLAILVLFVWITINIFRRRL